MSDLESLRDSMFPVVIFHPEAGGSSTPESDVIDLLRHAGYTVIAPWQPMPSNTGTMEQYGAEQRRQEAMMRIHRGEATQADEDMVSELWAWYDD